MAGPQSSLDAAGSAARVTGSLLWVFVILLGTIFLIVLGIAIASMFRRRRGIEQEPLEGTHRPSPQTERGLRRMVTGASVLTVLIILGLIVISVSTGKAISDRAMPANALTIEVTASQWWWSIRYLNDDASLIVTAANEIHVPVGRPVLIRGVSQDVIHSFWVPGLIGKRDLIPSRVTTEWFTAERAGKFRGQCAEFCGLQHAHMALWVVAETPAQFDGWMRAQRSDAVSPASASEQKGQKVFLSHACILCHTIRGTDAAGQVAPDMTHLGSRMTIAAGTLVNNRGNLAGWISDPQSIKPGNHMATVPIGGDDLQALLDYLGSLK
jgi:cytochrome c oxidase subunit II